MLFRNRLNTSILTTFRPSFIHSAAGSQGTQPTPSSYHPRPATFIHLSAPPSSLRLQLTRQRHIHFSTFRPSSIHSATRSQGIQPASSSYHPISTTVVHPSLLPSSLQCASDLATGHSSWHLPTAIHPWWAASQCHPLIIRLPQRSSIYFFRCSPGLRASLASSLALTLPPPSDARHRDLDCAIRNHLPRSRNRHFCSITSFALHRSKKNPLESRKKLDSSVSRCQCSLPEDCTWWNPFDIASQDVWFKRRSAWRDGRLDVRGRWQGPTGNRVPRTMSS